MKYRILKVINDSDFEFIIQKSIFKYWWRNVEFYMYFSNNYSFNYRKSYFEFRTLKDAEIVLQEVVLNPKIVENYRKIPIYRVLYFGVGGYLTSIKFCAPKLTSYYYNRYEICTGYSFPIGENLEDIKSKIDKKLIPTKFNNVVVKTIEKPKL